MVENNMLKEYYLSQVFDNVIFVNSWLTVLVKLALFMNVFVYLCFRQESEGTATPSRTPDSVLSAGSALSDFSRLSGMSGYSFRMPQKLQIVKPLEGWFIAFLYF